MTTIRTVTQKKAGAKPHPLIAKALERRFPEVKLWWATDVHRWALVQIRPGRPIWLIRVLRGPKGEYVAPTVSNTIHFLDSHHPSRFTGWAMKRFLQQLDESEAAQGNRVEAAQAPLREEIGDRVYSALRPKAVIQVSK